MGLCPSRETNRHDGLLTPKRRCIDNSDAEKARKRLCGGGHGSLAAEATGNDRTGHQLEISRNSPVVQHKDLNSNYTTSVLSPSSAPASPDDGVWIYFGTESGTAERFAEELREQAVQHGLKARVMDLDEFSEAAFMRHRCVVLIVATYGSGEPTSNAFRFSKWLHSKEHPSNLLTGVQFTVMALGSRMYEDFNKMGKTTDKRLQGLGATQVYELGIGDEPTLEDDWEHWKKHGLWPALLQATGTRTDSLESLDDHLSVSVDQTVTAADVVAELPLKIHFCGESALTSCPEVVSGGSDILAKWYFSAYKAHVLRSDQLRQKADVSHGLTTKHIDFDVSSCDGLKWRTADNLDVLPSNSESVVAWFAARLGVQNCLESKISFFNADSSGNAARLPFPTPCTVQMALTLYCDLNSMPTRRNAQKFAAFIRDDADREALNRLLSAPGVYHTVSTGTNRLALREFFELYMASAEVDLAIFLQLCGRQKSRPYTIASSFREDPKRISICVSMVKEILESLADVIETMGQLGHRPPRADVTLMALGETAFKKRDFAGVCSSMLCTRISMGEACWIAVRASGFHIPHQLSRPIVMIGAGTGIAPFHGFLREFGAEGGVRPEVLLVFGCRNRDEDYLYREEIESAAKRSPRILKEVLNAFSREQAEKVYVQHRIRERAQQFKALAADGAHFYVCGSTSMGAAVRKELIMCIGCESDLQHLRQQGRFYEELW
eukprot:TRINITY_DN107133_c0_g1_i1.p1 TRINITY_DN107133_c0_g1~~TRINITY_DN107133_c0_g1_i1.p1  ORF type:complete len:723 (+),score=108.91 TRINITY_DN107133_c0_g1_i1:108-2276(+)